MENRFLFRAKRIDTGEWVEGMPFEIEGKTMMLLQDNENLLRTHYLDENMWNSEIYCVEVDPSTICQCADLKDDDEILIFENDVLFLKEEINGCEWKAVVKFGNPNAEYTWGWQLVPITECDANKDIFLWVGTELKYMHCEIIGNKFDNPELLK